MTKTMRRKQIIDSASKIFAENGYHKSSISDIIEKAGVARGTFYLHFKNKRDIFHNILNRVTGDVDKIVRRLSLSGGMNVLLQDLQQNVRDIFSYFIEHRELTKILLFYSYGLDSEMDKMLNNFYKEMQKIIANSIKLGMSWGIIKPVNVQLISGSILGIFKETLVQIVNGTINKDQIDSSITEITRFAFYGLYGG